MIAQGIKIRIDDGPEVIGTLTIETEQIDVTMASKSKPDMAWEHVDSHGHFHAYDRDGNLPTLEAHTVHVDCGCGGEDYDCDGYDETTYVCPICEETVEPKVITWSPTEREYMPGRMSWEVLAHAHLERGQRVSVRITSGQPADEVTMFGVAQVVSRAHVRQQSEGAPVEALVKLIGVGPLGERRVKRPA